MAWEYSKWIGHFISPFHGVLGSVPRQGPYTWARTWKRYLNQKGKCGEDSPRSGLMCCFPSPVFLIQRARRKGSTLPGPIATFRTATREIGAEQLKIRSNALLRVFKIVLPHAHCFRRLTWKSTIPIWLAATLSAG